MQEDAPGCGRENDLVAFLYNELSNAEKKSFERHMHSCRTCLVQAGEFRSIRESVMAWRDESLGQGWVMVPQTSTLINQSKGSSLAALRAFFDLSPLWMKAAVGFAAMLFCVFGVLSVLNLKNPATITTARTDNPGYSREQLDALVEQRVQEELVRRKAVERQPLMSQASGTVKQNIVRAPSRAVLSRGNEVAAYTRSGKARRPLSKTEREQLASDLRLVLSGSESSINLIDDQINQ